MSCKNGESNCGISLNGWRLICPICDKCKSDLEQSITNLTRWNELKNEEIRQLQAEKQELKEDIERRQVERDYLENKINLSR